MGVFEKKLVSLTNFENTSGLLVQLYEIPYFSKPSNGKK